MCAKNKKTNKKKKKRKTQNAVFAQFGSDAAVNVVLHGSYRFNDYTVVFALSAGNRK